MVLFCSYLWENSTAVAEQRGGRSSWLALGAKIGPSIANRDAFNGGGADFAGLPTPMCYVESILLASRFAAGTAIVTDGGAGTADGFVEHLAYSSVQPLRLLFREAVGWPQRMDAGEEQRLIGVHVADAGDELLVA